MHTAGDTPASLPTTTLQVAEVTQDSVRLGWTPLQGATGYILRWREDTGIHVYFFSPRLPHTCSVNMNNLFLFHCSHFSGSGRVLSATLPASSSSYVVSGLRLGLRYRFTLQPTFASGLGTESSVDGRTGTANACFFHMLT